MSLFEQLQSDQIVARKGRDSARLSILQVVLSAIKNEKISRGRELTDNEAQAVIASQIKQLRDALGDFASGGRQDLIDKTQGEIVALESYLPVQLSDDELKIIAQKVITEINAKISADIGKVMGRVMSEVKGKADGNRVRKVVSQLLVRVSVS